MKIYIACALSILFGLFASYASAQSIVGAWTTGDTTVEGASTFIFFANGTFIQIQNAKVSEAPHGFDGFERGTYTWDSQTGALSFTTLQDLNGDTGPSNLNGVAGLTFTVAGDTGTFTIPAGGTVTGNRVTGASPIVGAWGFASTAPDSSAAIVFLPNGVYFMAQDGDSTAATGDPTGHDGIEHGTYSWNPASGAFTSSVTPAPYVDSNGAWGLSHSQGGTWKISSDLLTITVEHAGDSTSLPRVGPVSASAINYQGLWWNAPASSESGWGINFAHQGDVIFATWFTYDATGKALWLSMTANKAATGVYAGTLYQTRGPAFNAVPFSPTAVTATSVGTGTLTFTDTTNGNFAYVVNGIAQSKAITRQEFGTLPGCTAAPSDLAPATNYQDLWWASPAGIESGWGVNLTHQGDNIFVTWFTYDLDGTPLWLSATTPKTGNGIYAGSLYRTTGPAFSAVPFLPANVALTAVGSVTLNFTDGNQGRFDYTVNGVSQSKAIERQIFRDSGTVCR